jgi:hypothetical protein
MLNPPSLFFINIFVNLGVLGSLDLTFRKKNDKLGNDLL